MVCKRERESEKVSVFWRLGERARESEIEMKRRRERVSVCNHAIHILKNVGVLQMLQNFFLLHH
jgi:hypothetical protein